MTTVRTPTDDPLSHPRLEHPRTDVAAITGKYLSITSYRRDGSGVSTPVWFAAEGDRLLVMTDSKSGKVKRIRRNPYVTIAPCSGRGKRKAKRMRAQAELLPASEVERAKRLIKRKYRFDLLFVGPIRAIQALFHPERRHEVTAIIAITAPPA
jgi:PPOX class probable F420-dependent enzyme